MAKRELSTTLRNLKFMQRGAAAAAPQKPDQSKKGEGEQHVQIQHIDDKTNPINIIGASSSSSSSSLPSTKFKCTVIMEGNPHPGAIKGRMSFGSFNPSIDKLNEAAVSNHEIRSSPPTSVRLDRSESTSPATEPDLDLKRKKPASETENPSPSKLQKNNDGDTGMQSSSSNEHCGNKNRGFNKPSKRDKLDWNILRPPRKP